MQVYQQLFQSEMKLSQYLQQSYMRRGAKADSHTLN